jgi:hypothetical protein
MYKSILFRSIFFFGLILFAVSETFGQGKVMVTTTEKNFEVTSLNCGCPKDENGNAFAVDAIKLGKNWNDKQVDEFTKLLTDFETENGVDIKSKSKTKDFRLKSDEIKTECVGPLSGAGKKLCDFLRRNM